MSDIADRALTDVTFASLNLDERLNRGLADAGFERLTPIQAQALPPALEGKDVAGQGQTGTGKTAAFLLAAMQRMLAREPHPKRPHNDPRTLIIAPTRELARQIHADALQLGKHTGFLAKLVHGGVDYQKQRDDVAAGVDILIGTPGRTIDYFKQRVFGLRNVEVMVLDEADRMFDLGFIKDIRYLLRRIPPPDQRLGLMFSATLSHRVLELAYEHMNDPLKIKVESETVTADRVDQRVYFPANREKVPLLVALIRASERKSTMVFTNTKAAADRVARHLSANDIHAETLSGDVPQKKRQKLLQRFHDAEIEVLVATDVAARGLHIPDVSHVFNYDVPQDPEDYVHRIGRTARLGAKGEAITFACEDYAFTLPDIEEYIGFKLPVESIDESLLPEIERLPRRPPRKRPPKRAQGGSGDAGSKKKRRRRRRRKPQTPAPAAD